MATGASSYSVKDCECRKKGIYDCKFDRRFSDPNAFWGWDSYNSRHFYGYTGYFAATYNPDVKLDLPIYLRIFDAKRHDSTSLLLPSMNIDIFILTLNLTLMS